MASDALKVAIFPRWSKPDKADGGIRRVVEAQEKYLPQFGIELVSTYDEADVICTHGTTIMDQPADKPIVNVNHGLYWSIHDWPHWAHHANSQVVEAMMRAQFHTAPSNWVANALRRGMMVYPEVVHHGIDADEWTPVDDHHDFVLWNKARADAVSDPQDMVELARRLPGVRFVSTIGGVGKPSNVEEIGVMTVHQIREFVQHAGVYLATARETFGIGTLEAMACGVPVVGWDWGGQSEIVKHGETGFLANPGDYEALAEGIRWALEERKTLGANARQDVLDRWGWERRIKQYANLFERANEWWNDHSQPKVSVVVTTHNLAGYLGECLDSVEAQEFESWECVVIDDASEDDPRSVVEGRMESGSDKIRFIRSEKNLKLPGARNFGFEQSNGRYIVFLDADDMLAPGALKTLSEQLDLDPGIHIAYGHLDTVSDDGKNQKRSEGWPYKEFNWRGQMAHLNQLPYSAMMRREVLERTGGYRERYWRNEDAPFWILATSYGFRAEKVTEASTLIYRWRSDSKTQSEPGEGDWTAWFPWRMGATTGQEGAGVLQRTSGHPTPDLVPWSAQGISIEEKKFWPVPDHASPRVSVIIPVGPGHEELVIDALESIRGQTFTDWEVIVINATGKKWESGFRSPVQGCPWARVIDPSKILRPSEARNLGITFAKAEALLILDADDMVLPHALEEMYSWYIGTGGGLIYTDLLKAEPGPLEPMQLIEFQEFRCGAVLFKMQHSMMCLIPKAKHDEIGGYDETMPGWEDWDYLIALQAAGVCSYRVPTPGFVYRFRKGTIREDSFGKHEKIIALIRAKWSDYYDRRKTMGCGKCPGGQKAIINPYANPGAEIANSNLQGSQAPLTLLAYQGPGSGKVTLRGPITGTRYIFHPDTPKYVMTDDAEVFLGRSRNGVPDFVIVQRPQEKPRVTIPVEFTKESAELDFPEMPGRDSREAGEMTISEIAEAIVDARPELLLQWLEEERAGKNRKGAISALEAALELQPA